jgi:general secretion pathway protein A
MYQKHWGLKHPPFNEAHDSAYFVDSESLQLARAKLKHVAVQGQNAAAVTGPAGVGKTALVRQFLREFEAEGWACSLIVNPLGDPWSILECIAHDLGGGGGNALESLESALAGLMRAERRACIAIDEVHTIQRAELLENLRMLLNMEVHGNLPLNLILCGQPSMLPIQIGRAHV